MNDHLQRQNERLRQSLEPLPGSEPYDNRRPINVRAQFEGQTLFECLCAMHPHISPLQWREWFDAGHILQGRRPVGMQQIVRGGHQYLHLFPETVEPDVNAEVEIIWEDDALIAVHKPAPLPVHPSGRFNRNTLTSFLTGLYERGELRPVHRLDANTTGVMMFARTRQVATQLRQQFERDEVRKRYLVRCSGQPTRNTFVCDEPIARQRSRAGSRDVDSEGYSARTEFRMICPMEDGSTLLEARPLTGRTNQIRIHLWAMGMPVVGDPTYLKDNQVAHAQTISVDGPPMCLHAAHLSLAHPVTDEPLELAATNPGWTIPNYTETPELS